MMRGDRMACRILTYAVILGVVALAASADAQTVTTTRRVALHRKPSAKSPIVKRVPKRTKLEQVSRRGRWVEVSRGKHRGWVLAAHVEANAADEPTERNEEAASASTDGNTRVVVTRGATKTIVTTPLFEKPGEASKKLARVGKRTKLRVLAHKGRWLRVRVAGKTGWIPRTTVQAVAAPAPTQREVADDNKASQVWGKASSISVAGKQKAVVLGQGSVRVTTTDSAHVEPSPKAAPVFDITRGEHLQVSGHGEREGWLFVQNTQGLTGWVRRGSVQMIEAPALAASATVSDSDTADVAEVAPSVRVTRYMQRGIRVRTRARTGLSSLSVNFSSDGASALAAYRVSASAVSAAVSTEVSYVHESGAMLGADALYQISVGRPGIRYMDEAGASLSPVGFSLQQMNAVVRAGYQVSDRGVAAGRIGYHFDWFQVDEVDNPGLLAREGLRGLTAGVQAEVVLTGNLVVRSMVDALLSGRRKQTPGLEDGAESDALAVWGRIELTYLLSSQWAVDGAYHTSWASTEWTGQSPRQSDVTQALRTDRTHLVLAGLSRSF